MVTREAGDPRPVCRAQACPASTARTGPTGPSAFTRVLHLSSGTSCSLQGPEQAFPGRTQVKVTDLRGREVPWPRHVPPWPSPQQRPTRDAYSLTAALRTGVPATSTAQVPGSARLRSDHTLPGTAARSPSGRCLPTSHLAATETSLRPPCERHTQHVAAPLPLCLTLRGRAAWPPSSARSALTRCPARRR